MNKYNSVVPSEMSQRELTAICGDIQTAKNWKLSHITVKLTNDLNYKVDVSRHKDYQNELKIKTGRTLVNFSSPR